MHSKSVYSAIACLIIRGFLRRRKMSCYFNVVLLSHVVISLIKCVLLNNTLVDLLSCLTLLLHVQGRILQAQSLYYYCN
jgi:hypothetical protein